MRHAGTGKMMTCILVLSYKERDFIYHWAFSPSLAVQPSHVNKHSRPEALLTETELNIPQHTCMLFCFDWLNNGEPFLRTGTDTHSAPAHLHGQTPHYPLFQSRALWASCRCIFFKRSKLSSHTVFVFCFFFQICWLLCISERMNNEIKAWKCNLEMVLGYWTAPGSAKNVYGVDFFA